MKAYIFLFLFPLFILSLLLQPLQLVVVAAEQPSTSASKDTQNLVHFKSTLSNHSLLPDWVPNRSPCSFSGVKCQEPNKISSIDLSSTSLSTDFHLVATFLLTLPFLESLSLNSANISGPVSFPAGSRCSSVLSYLDLSQNGLSGPVPEISSLAACPALKSLNLSRNFLEFPVPKDKSSLVLRLSLESLDLSFNKVVGSNVIPFISPGGCSELKFLTLKGNKVSGDVNVSGCKKLQFLDISSNNFSSPAPSLGDCSALDHLDISANKFYGDLGGAIGSCGKLSFLNVSSNKFSGQVPAVPTANLQYLSLGGNHFQGEIPLNLVDACPGLVILDLSSNNLSGPVPSTFASCLSLETFDVSSNNFSGELPVGTFLKMSSLRRLDLAYNHFSGFLSDSFSKHTSLESLDLSSNELSGTIPAGLCQDPSNNIKELYLQNNMFTGTIPATLSNCSRLTALHLSFNFLTGTIPSSLGSLSQLRDLNLWFNQLHGEIPPEIMNIKALNSLILDYNELTGVIPSSISNCTDLNWISLSNNRFTGEIPASIGQLSSLAILKLSNNSFYGRIPPELGDCRSLIWLDLNTNFFNGTIPPDLFKQSGNIAVNFITGKRYVYLKNDKSEVCHGQGNLLEFAGIRPEHLLRIGSRQPCNFTRVYVDYTQPLFNYNGSMIFLDLSYNFLDGTIPKEIGSMSYLYILNLGHNNLSGTIPDEIGKLTGLNILDLSNNGLEGNIPPSMTVLSWLTEIDMSNNHLTGTIPESGQFETFSNRSFLNNSGLCGIPLPPCGSGSGTSGNSQHQKSHRKQASLVGSVAMGLLFSLFCIFAFIIVTVEMKKRKKKQDSALDVYIDSRSHSGTANSGWKFTGAREALSIGLTTFADPKPLRKLTFADLLEATNGFHNDSLIGSGGFGDVYKAQLKDGSTVAIKKLKHISGQGDREFTAEMETIGKIKHRNLVPLLGYCKVGEERLLVYEYMKHGSLEDVLHNGKKNGIKLNWAARRKIAIGAARGLTYLHTIVPHIIHRDMKSSNVLLDENLDARVSDFGMARYMNGVDTHLSVSTLAGTPGYVPPEYYQTFRCSVKGDVYSYGVVLLELLTGKRPTDSADFGDNNLVGWVKQHAKLKISDVFDPVLLKEDASLEIELLEHLQVAIACLDDRAWKRPTMIQVMARFKEIQAGAGSGLDSQSTIATEEGGGYHGVEMSIKEVPEVCSKE